MPAETTATTATGATTAPEVETAATTETAAPESTTYVSASVAPAIPDPAAPATFTKAISEVLPAPTPVVPQGPTAAQVGQLILELTILVAEAPGLLTGEIDLATYRAHCDIIMKSVTKIFPLEN
jgi:hypothetical protein